MIVPLLKDIIIIFGLSIAVLLLFHRFRIPSIVGFLITGIVAGPEGLRLISDVEKVKVLSEIGIIVLLFTVGMEFSLKKIFKYKRYFFLAGPIQVILTACGGFLAGEILGRPWNESIFLGFLLSLSSTAIVMRLFQERGETNTPHGQLSLGILIFQDVIAVPMMLLTPFLGGNPEELNASILYRLGEGAVILIVTFYSGIQLVPTLLFHAAKTRSRELFLLTVLLICFSVAWIASSVGLSLAIGAFLAGLVISESEYSAQAIVDVIPFQDIFTSFFFVSIGMLLDIGFLLEHSIPIFLITSGVFILKSGTVSLIAMGLGFPIRSAVLSGIALSQVGEFSFVLGMYGISNNLGTEFLHKLFIAVSILTMALTPTMIAISPWIAAFAQKLPLSQRMLSGIRGRDKEEMRAVKNHIIIVGFGFSGKNVARSSKEADVPYAIIDMNPETVLKEREKGEAIYFGDATGENILKFVNIKEARALAVLINDPIAAIRVVERARKLNPEIYIIVRARRLEEMPLLFKVGANDVIPDELGASLEIFARVLVKYEVPRDHIEQLVKMLREEGYEMARPRYLEKTVFSDLPDTLSVITVKTIILSKNSPFAEKSLEEAQLRKNFGFTVIVIKRGDQTIYNIDSTTILQGGDQLVIVGIKRELEESLKKLGYIL